MNRIVLTVTPAIMPLLSAALATNHMCPGHVGLRAGVCNGECIKCWNKAFEEANGWIRVSEQTPYVDGKPMANVIVTMEDCDEGRFVTNALDKAVTRENKIIAWQPYPEVYKGEA